MASKFTQAAFSTPKRYGYKILAATAYGLAVKLGSDQDVAQVVSATTDKAIGILQNTTTEANEVAEVALPGGGAKAKLGGTVAVGDELGFASDGRLQKVASANDRVIAIAMSEGVANDLIPVEVVAHKAVGTQA